jgi:anti-sigma regulatory factor (Ser/Thr protein kinase)
LREALLNALYHGNLEVSSRERDKGIGTIQAVADERAGQAPYRDRRIYVDSRLARDEAVFVVRDEGRGFDPTSLPDPTDPANLENLSGRGVLLMKTFMDEVVYNSTGNQVTLVKRGGNERGTGR